MQEGMKTFYNCISFFKSGKCPRAHTCNCPFVIKGVDYSKECIYSNKRLVSDTKRHLGESGEGSIVN